jgi:hypothetical protein
MTRLPKINCVQTELCTIQFFQTESCRLLGPPYVLYESSDSCFELLNLKFLAQACYYDNIKCFHNMFGVDYFDDFCCKYPTFYELSQIIKVLLLGTFWLTALVLCHALKLGCVHR